MMKTSLDTAKVFERISKGSLYLLVFLLPLFFLPWTSSVLDFNKQILLVVLASVSLLAGLVRTLIVGKLSFNVSWFHIPVLVFFLVYLFSTLFSLWPYGSFWGWPKVTSESLLTVIGLTLLYFLVVNILRKKEMFFLIASLVLSSSLAMLFGIFQLFGAFVLPFSFTKAVSFNTIGSPNSLGVFAAVLLPLIMVLAIAAKRFWRILFIGALLVSTLVLFVINFQVAWWIVGIGAALMLIFGMHRRDVFDTRWLVLPMFFLAIALLMSFFRFQIPGVPARPAEVSLTHGASFDIAWQAVRESPILGSGPGTFAADFSLYRDVGFNNSVLWDIRFDWGSSKILTLLATTGVLGVLSLLALIAGVLYFGIRFLFRSALSPPGANEAVKIPVRKISGVSKKETSEKSLLKLQEQKAEDIFFWLLGLGMFISFIALSAAYFLHRSNVSFDVVYFVLMGGLIALIAATPKEFVLKPSSLLTLSVTFMVTLVFVFSLGIFILEGQKYVAEVRYVQGIKALRQGNSEEAIRHIRRAVEIAPRVDLYWRNVSQIYLLRAQEEIREGASAQEEGQRRIQALIEGALDSARAATDANPTNVVNWSVRGFVHQSLSGIIGGAQDWAIRLYDEAMKLDPKSPYFPTQKGITLLRKAAPLPESEAEEKGKLLGLARAEFEKAVALKSDYAPARFQIAMTYQIEGRQAEAMAQLEKTKIVAPFDVGLAFQLGLLYYQDREYEKAIQELKRAILMNPDYANALYFLGLSYNQLEQRDNAIDAFKRVGVLNPDNREVQTILGNLQAGRDALAGITGREPPVVPIEEALPEKLEEGRGESEQEQDTEE